MRFVCRYVLALAVALVVVVPLILLLHITYKYNVEDPEQIVHLSRTPNPAKSRKTRMDCRFHNCFDIHRCDPQTGGQFKVYVHPRTKFLDHHQDRVFQTYSYEFDIMLNALRNSKFATKNISEGCLFVPPIDVLSEVNLDPGMVAEALNSMQRFEDMLYPSVHTTNTKDLA